MWQEADDAQERTDRLSAFVTQHHAAFFVGGVQPEPAAMDLAIANAARLIELLGKHRLEDPELGGQTASNVAPWFGFLAALCLRAGRREEAMRLLTSAEGFATRARHREIYAAGRHSPEDFLLWNEVEALERADQGEEADRTAKRHAARASHDVFRRRLAQY